MSEITLTPVTAGSNVSNINSNFTKLETSVNSDILHLADGNNTMRQVLDMNGYSIINYPSNPSDPTALVSNSSLLNEAALRLNADTALAQQLAALQAGANSGLLGYQTKALLDADTSKPIGTVALVTNDPTTANNLTYRWDGSTWVASIDRVSLETTSRIAGDSTIISNLASSTGSAGVGFLRAATGATLRSVQDKLQDTFHAKDFGLKADGVTDDTVALQRAFTAASTSTRGRRLILPAGRIRVSGQITYSGAPLTLEGDGQNATVIEWYTGTGGGITINSGTPSAGFPDVSNEFVIKDLTLHASAAGQARGISVVYVPHGGVEAYMHMDKVAVIVTGSGTWTDGVYVENISDGIISNSFIYVDVRGQNCLNINNSQTNPNFGFLVSNCSMNGGASTSINVAGWLESLTISNTTLVGAITNLVCTAVGTTFGDTNLFIKGCHFNAKQTNVYANLWRTIIIEGCDMYHGVGTGDVSGTNLDIHNASKVIIGNCKIECPVGTLNSGAISLDAVQDVLISNNYINVSNTGISCAGSGTVRINISNNLMVASNGAATGSGVYLGHTAGESIVVGNKIKGYTNGVQNIGPFTVIKANAISNCTTGINSSGSNDVDARGNTMWSNTTDYSGLMRRDFKYTLSLAPGAVANNTSGAVALSIPGLLTGDSISVAAPGSLSNLLVSAWVNGSNSGVLNFYNLTGGSVTPPSGNYIFYVSN